MAHLLGIDLGTSGARALVVDAATGAVVAAHSSEMPLHTPRPLWAEQDPDDWWQATRSAIAGAVGAARTSLGGRLELRAAGLSGQMHGVALVDREGLPIGRALLWCDGRTEAECAEITEKVGAERLLDLVGNPALPGFSAPKLVWLRKHRAADLARARACLLPKDYVRLRLTGEYASEVSDASGTLLFDVKARRWSRELLDALEIEPSLLPAVHESPVPSGTVTAAVAEALGLPPGLPVVGGGGDQAAGAVGAGIVRAGLLSATIGSSGVVFAHSDTPARDRRVHSFCHAVPGAWHVMGVTQGAGLSLRWLRERLAPGATYDALVAEAATAPPGCDGLLFAPYLMGERTPHFDANARGAWVGLTYAHQRAHMIRSVLEGVAYSLRDCLDIFTAIGVPGREVRAAGGGARSALWRDILADVFDRPIEMTDKDEGPAYGAALLAGVGAGIWGTVEDAADACVHIVSRHEPVGGRAAVYRDGHARYRELYPRLSPLVGATE
jgi:xylulokinase